MIPWLTGLPVALVPFALLALALSALQWAMACVLVVTGGRAQRQRPELGGEEDYLWVFFVPALNEEVTIADTVERLVALEAVNKIVVIIDDGSTDETQRILAGIEHPDLRILRRDAPKAQKGKGAALNNAWRLLHDSILKEPRWRHFTTQRILVVVVDADGRLDPDFTDATAGHFDDASVGGVQLRVHIYNTWSLLPRLQEVEFCVYGGLYQMGRTPWGTAGMGGNGQINRLSALDDVARYNGAVGEQVPWRDRLTEDQDLAISLLACGWNGRQELRRGVHQQGVAGPRRLYRQRTRWAQGCLQACRRMRVPLRASISLPAKVEYVQWLLQPLIQFYLGLVLVGAIVLIALGRLSPIPTTEPWIIAVIAVISLGGTSLGCVAAWMRTHPAGILVGLAWAIPYALYSWFLMPVFVQAIIREATGRSGWAKTAREPLSRRR